MSDLKKLWVEAHRPPTLEGYVFKNPEQKAQIEKWIADRSIPHLLFSGIQGTGKCLMGREEIAIRVDETKLTDGQKKILGIAA